ncbi:ferredoxin [Lysinibacillus antri]|uniref:Uncharacterized protein n=1 Tax=Lysinibacillus antri TaxID=2498145 RepID=A0A3S0P3U4_9BACI|nr:hypothetical protein [Lysinibacillus antri]RUL51928.1 hypothetical protein EK386_11345 [Lysinibacillus antri]
MKQIHVNEKCSGCGLCIVNSPYLQENAEGNAEPVAGMAIQEKDMDSVMKVVGECPESALQIVETGNTNKTGAAGITDIINALKNQCDNFSVKKVSNSDIKLNIKDYYIPIPSSSREYKRDYSSESSAKSAAKDEFNRLCYSETAFRPMIKKVFVEYKVNVLKPYYTCTDTEDSAYYAYNQQIRKLLSDAYAEIGEVLGGNNKIPEDWKKFSVYLKEKDGNIVQLTMFDERSTSSGIISTMKDISHTGLNDYVNGMDFDYDEKYVGEGLFGKVKYKNVWYYSGFHDAAKEFIDDLTWAIGHMSSDIEEGVVIDVNHALKSFEKKVKEELSAKISELENLCKNQMIPN